MRNEQTVELDGPPAFTFGQKVRVTRDVRNDGTFAGYEIGDVLIRQGDIGYIKNIGTYLQQFYIYGVEFIKSGRVVGMRAKELELLED